MHSCSSCAKRFKTRSGLNAHFEAVHSTECQVCGKTFGTAAARDQHFNAVHLHVEPNNNTHYVDEFWRPPPPVEGSGEWVLREGFEERRVLATLDAPVGKSGSPLTLFQTLHKGANSAKRSVIPTSCGETSKDVATGSISPTSVVHMIGAGVELADFTKKLAGFVNLLQFSLRLFHTLFEVIIAENLLKLTFKNFVVTNCSRPFIIIYLSHSEGIPNHTIFID